MTIPANIVRKFTTRNTSAVPTTLSGSPVVSIYKDVTTTPSIAGVTLTVNFGGVTGLNHVFIDTTADATFYADGHHYDLVITTGTVGGVSVVGEAVGSWDSGPLTAVLGPTGLDQIPATDPGGVATTFPQMIVAIWRLWFKKSVKAVSGLTIKTYADDGTTVRTTSTYTDDGAGNQTRNAAT